MQLTTAELILLKKLRRQTRKVMLKELNLLQEGLEIFQTIRERELNADIEGQDTCYYLTKNILFNHKLDFEEILSELDLSKKLDEMELDRTLRGFKK